MKALKDYWPIAAALVAGGMWLGSLAARVDQLERRDNYVHGQFTVPER